MSELVELLFWGFVLLAVGLRSVARRRSSDAPGGDVEGAVTGDWASAARWEQDAARPPPGGKPAAGGGGRARAPEPRARARPGETPRGGRGDAGVPATRRADLPGRRRELPSRRSPPQSPMRTHGGPVRGSEARRPSMREQWIEIAKQLQREMQEQAAGARGELPAPGGEDLGDMVVVPGRRVVVDRELESAETTPRRAPPPAAPSDRRRAPHDAEGRRAPRHAPGLARLERFGPLQRAVILSEILGTPPGLPGGRDAGARWDRVSD